MFILLLLLRTCRIVDFAVLADYRIKLKESEKRDIYLDLAKEIKKKTMEVLVHFEQSPKGW